MDAADNATCDRALSAVRSSIPGELVTKVVVIAESIDGDGKRGVWTMADDDMTQWDVIGLLEWASHRARFEDPDEF